MRHIIAQKQGDLSAAEQWYHKSLAIKEKQGSEHGAAFTYNNLGVLAHEQERYEQAGHWFVKALRVFCRVDKSNANGPANGFAMAYRKADESTRSRLKAMWEGAGRGELPESE
ncbi:MAG: tetratricopeptide repeat protein [Planctomycetota bacterium]|nr:tetratricopeptide repeat protein [Planctomycetota bacterium]